MDKPSGFVVSKIELENDSDKKITILLEKYKYILIEITLYNNDFFPNLWSTEEEKKTTLQYSLSVITSDGLSTFCSKTIKDIPIMKSLSNRAFLTNLETYNEMVVEEVKNSIHSDSDLNRLKDAWKRLSRELKGLTPVWLSNSICRVKSSRFEKATGESVEDFGEFYSGNIKMSVKRQNDIYTLIYFSKPVHLSRFKSYDYIVKTKTEEIMEKL